MKIAVHVSGQELFDKKWIQYINMQEDCEAVKVNLKKSDVLDEIKNCDGVMWHFLHNPWEKDIAQKILTTIEMYCKIPVWPNYETRWHFDEKVTQHFMFHAMNVPSVPSWVFFQQDEAYEFAEKFAEYPLVYKLSVGAGAANVKMVANQNEAFKLIKTMFQEGVYPYTENEFSASVPFQKRLLDGMNYVIKSKRIMPPWYYELQKNYIYFQKFIPNNSRDIRVTIIGDRAFAFSRKNRENDFRASGSGKIDYNLTYVPLEAIQIAFQISQKNHFQSMAYDFLIDEQGRPLVSEMSYGYLDTAVYDCSGYWDAELKWHEGHIWPEQAHIDDFICLLRDRKPH